MLLPFTIWTEIDETSSLLIDEVSNGQRNEVEKKEDQEAQIQEVKKTDEAPEEKVKTS
jgi:hypothetical protein